MLIAPPSEPDETGIESTLKHKLDLQDKSGAGKHAARNVKAQKKIVGRE